MATLFIDANIFPHAVGGEGPIATRVGPSSQPWGQGRLAGVTSSEVLREIMHVRARRMGAFDAVAAVRATAALVGEVLPVGVNDVLEACELLAAHPRFRARAALHAAVMRTAGIAVMVSVDRDFDAVPHVQRVGSSEVMRQRDDGGAPGKA